MCVFARCGGRGLLVLPYAPAGELGVTPTEQITLFRALVLAAASKLGSSTPAQFSCARFSPRGAVPLGADGGSDRGTGSDFALWPAPVTIDTPRDMRVRMSDSLAELAARPGGAAGFRLALPGGGVITLALVPRTTAFDLVECLRGSGPSSARIARAAAIFVAAAPSGARPAAALLLPASAAGSVAAELAVATRLLCVPPPGLAVPLAEWGRPATLAWLAHAVRELAPGARVDVTAILGDSGAGLALSELSEVVYGSRAADAGLPAPAATALWLRIRAAVHA